MPVFFRLAGLLALAAIALAGAAHAATAHITFILVNDIYLMEDQMMPDGQRRGGFARLAAVVKAERAKGGHVVLAHAGDTLSPSLMSSIDHGAHIIALTNMVAPDIFAPGNHEFDFGKATFLQRMDEAQFPLFAANLRGPDGRPLAKFKDRSAHRGRRRPHWLDRRDLRRLGARLEPAGPDVCSHRRDHAGAGGTAAP